MSKDGSYGSSAAAAAAAAAAQPDQPAAAAAVVPSSPTTTFEVKPLTIFYNGRVATFHLTQDKAENVMNMAAGQEEQDDDAADSSAGRRQLAAAAAAEISESGSGDQLLEKLKRELPIANKRSLVRFFQKRKERLYRP